jgi:photosystem II stability/assembly factor-like uncharacterized protein
VAGAGRGRERRGWASGVWAGWFAAARLPAALVLVAVAALLCCSADAQARTPSWELQRLAAPALGAGEQIEALSVVDPDAAWVAGSGNAVFSTHDGGRSWTRLATGAPETTVWSAVRFADALHGFLAGVDLTSGVVYATADGGRTWAERLRVEGTPFTGLDVCGTELGWVCGRAGAVYATVDGGATWTPQLSTTGVDLNAVSFAGWDRGLAVGDHGAIIRTHDGGLTWKPVRSHTTHVLRGISYVERRVGFTIGAGGVVLKTDSWGHRWRRLGTPDPQADRVAEDFASGRRGLVALAGGELMGTRDGGRTWHLVRHHLGDLGELCDVEYASSHPVGAWIAARDAVFRFVATGTPASLQVR